MTGCACGPALRWRRCGRSRWTVWNRRGGGQGAVDLDEHFLRQVFRFRLADHARQVAQDFRAEFRMDLLKIQYVFTHLLAFCNKHGLVNVQQDYISNASRGFSDLWRTNNMVTVTAPMRINITAADCSKVNVNEWSKIPHIRRTTPQSWVE